MLRADRTMLEAQRFFLCQHQDMLDPVGEAIATTNPIRGSCVFPLDDCPEHVGELSKRIARTGVCFVLGRGSNALTPEVVLKIGRCKSVISTNAISGEFAFVHQAADRDWINMEDLCYFLGGHEMFHSSSVLHAKKTMYNYKNSAPLSRLYITFDKNARGERHATGNQRSAIDGRNGKLCEKE